MPLLFYANPEIDADLLYFGGFLAPDPFLALGVGNRKIAVLSPLELGRGRRESAFTEILSLTEVRSGAAKRYKTRKPTPVQIIRHLLALYQVKEVSVSETFPAFLALELKKARVNVKIKEGAFLPARERKSEAEAAAIREGNAASAAGFDLLKNILSESRITRKGTLNWKGKPLTSERCQIEIEKALLERGARSLHTIVAGGDQACDPHERGRGPLRAHQLIIADIFPRVIASGYHGDMTRTFLKGTPSDEQVRLVQTVKAAHDAALKTARSGISGSKVHAAVTHVFDKADYPTRQTENGYEGFFHSTGHGLGLDVHEPPRVGPGTPRLKKQAVVTIEPGLYYPGLGGCRIEDVIRLQPNRYELLSNYPYDWILPP